MSGPLLPPGRMVDLPGRGRTFVREVAGPPGAPTLLLLHGWTASADLNWFPAYRPLARSFRVVAMDLRGHGRGIRSRRRFRFEDCADDAAALVDHLGTGPVVAVGYSMGGPVAQLLWKRHRHLVDGLVLCATSRTFASRLEEKLGFAGLGLLSLAARATPLSVQHYAASRLIGVPEGSALEAWVRRELSRNDWTAILEAGRAIGGFDARRWIGQVDVPTAVLATMVDDVVATKRQVALARSIPGATLHPVQGGHTVCVRNPERFVPVLAEVCRSVTRRIEGEQRQPAS